MSTSPSPPSDAEIRAQLDELARLRDALTDAANRGDVYSVDRLLKIGERRLVLLAALDALTDESEVDELARLRAARDSRRAAT